MTDTKRISTVLVVMALMLLGVYMGMSVVTDAAGGLAALVPIMVVIMSIVAIMNPIKGLYVLAALVIWVDEFKRLAVYYGGANASTVYQTLAMPIIVIGALNFKFLMDLVAGKVKIDKYGVMIYAISGLVGITVLITNGGLIQQRLQRGANIACYISLIPIVYTYLKTFDSWRKFFSFQALVALPAAAWTFRQYFYGFTDIEWTYARTGLSLVHYSQMFAENPRVFGFFGSASALSCAAIYCAFSWWHTFTQPRRRLLWILAALVYTMALVLSTQRTALIYPLLIIPFVFLFRRPTTTVASYFLGLMLFITGIFSSKWLVDEGLEKINQSIMSNSRWGQLVLNVDTYSDRLRGWERLSRPDTYSWLGTGKEYYSEASDGVTFRSEEYNHDIINKVLLSYGVIGLIILAIPLYFLILAMHRIIFNQFSLRLRNNAAFALAITLPMIVLSFVGGDNFSTNPINIQLWTAMAGVFVCRTESLNLLRAHKSKSEAVEKIA